MVIFWQLKNERTSDDWEKNLIIQVEKNIVGIDTNSRIGYRGDAMADEFQKFRPMIQSISDATN